MSIRRRLKITVSGVRGVVGETFSPALAVDFASAFGALVGRGPILVGRDTRSSGELFEHAVTAGLIAAGSQVVHLGIIPTPTIQAAVRAFGAVGAVMITASHNPVEWNALKFIGPDGYFLDPANGNELLDIYNQPDANNQPESELRPVRAVTDAFDLHCKRIFDAIDVDAVRKAHFKVAADCCNGVGALYTRPFLEALGAEVVTIYDDPGKAFERPPEPTAGHITALSECVKTNRCDIGFAQDPDGDRLAIVTDTGGIPGVQNSLLPAVEHLLSMCHNQTVVCNIQTTRAVETIAAKYGSHVCYAPVGEVNVTSAMAEHRAYFGLEGSSGGLLVSHIMPCRDSYTAMALTLEMMALRKQSIQHILDEVPHYFSVEKKIDAAAQPAINALRRLAQQYAELHPVTVDGVRISFGDSWILARTSNTEAVVRILAEAPSQAQAGELAERFAREISLRLN